MGEKLGKYVHEIMELPVTELYEYMAFYLSQNDEFIEKMRIKGKLPRVIQDPKKVMDDMERKLKIMSRQK